MPEQTPVSLNHFAVYRFTDGYFELDSSERKQVHHGLLSALHASAECVHVYQVFPAQAQADILVWSASRSGSSSQPAEFFSKAARSMNGFRRWLEPKNTLWGFTRPSQYTKTRSNQEIDPFSETRLPYLVAYPFTKTIDWYLMSREARQGMMNEHIRIGKEFLEISQLLLYSFGLQDQEFVVVYETPDLAKFSELVGALREAEGRRFTLRDTPNFTAIYHPAEETLALWE